MSARNWEDEGGAAFPVNVPDGTDPQEYGMSLRDHFAGLAMQGMLANPQQDYAPLTQKAQYAIVNGAYEVADAMLAARKGSAS